MEILPTRATKFFHGEHKALCPSAKGGFIVHFVKNLCVPCGKSIYKLYLPRLYNLWRIFYKFGITNPQQQWHLNDAQYAYWFLQ